MPDKNGKPLRGRTLARAIALQALCVYDVVGDGFDDQLNEFLVDPEMLGDLDQAEPPSSETTRFARLLAREAWHGRQSADELLEQLSPRWSVRRMSLVDRNILRIGAFELRAAAADAPPQIVIDEAIELARRFGDRESPAFVNGVLDGLRKHWLQAGTGAGPARA